MQRRKFRDRVGAVAQGRRPVLAGVEGCRGLAVEVLDGIAFVVPVARLAVGGLGSCPVRAGAKDLAAAVSVVNAEADQQAGKAGGPALAGAVPVQEGRERNLRGLLLDGLCRLAGPRR